MPSKVGNELVFSGQMINAVALANGNIVISYQSGVNYYAQLVNFEGLLGSPIQSTSSFLTVSSLPNSNFVVCYQSGSNYYAQLVISTGSLLGIPIQSTSSSLTVTALPNSNFVLNYQNGSNYYVQLISSAALPLGTPIQSTSFSSTISVLPNSNFVVSYQSGSNYYAQLVSNTGSLLGSPTQSNTSPANTLQVVIVLSNGNFVVSYDAFSGHSAQIVVSNGSLLGSPILFAGQIQTMITLPNSNFVVSYQSSGFYDPQLVSSSGSLIGGTGSTQLPLSSIPLQLTALPNSNFVVGYYTLSTNYGAQLVSNSSTLLGNPISSTGTFLTINILPNSNFVVNGSNYAAELVNSSGSLLGNPIQSVNIPPQVIALPNSNFVVSYKNGSNYDIQPVNANGTLVGIPIQSTYQPAVTVLQNGNFAVFYQNLSNANIQLINSILTPVSSSFQITQTFTTSVQAFALSNDYLFAGWQTPDRNTHAQIFYVGTNLTIVNSNQQLNYFQDSASIALNEITILTEYNTANATLTLTDPQAGVLTTISSNNVTASFNSQQGVWQADGDVNDVNAALNATQFIPAPNYVGNFTVNLAVQNEGGQTATGALQWTGIPTQPILKNNTLTIQEGQSVLLDNSNFGIFPITRPVTFTLSNVKGGYFSLVNNPNQSIFQFTQQQINTQQIEFVSNRTAAVSYDVGVSDGRFTLLPVPANVNFSNPAPIVLNAPATKVVNVDQSFNFVLSANQIFNDTDGDPLTYSAELSDGSVLPNWLQFDSSQSNQLAFSGAAPAPGGTQVSLVAKDPLNASISTGFEILAIPKNGTNTIIGITSAAQIVGGVVGGVLGLAAAIGTGLGFWRYAANKNTRKGEPFADAIRAALNLKDVDDFDSDTGQQFVAFIHNLQTVLKEAGVDTHIMRPLERRQLADDVADAARNKISTATDCLGRSVITVDDLNNRLQDIVTEVQVLRADGQKFVA